MSRPSFQFYPGDWQKNANLRRCSPAARGVWMDILCLLHDSETEYGVLRWPLKDIANAASAPMPLVRELVEKGVLKGGDKNAEPYVYRPKHGGKVGDPVILVAPLNGPVWYSSRFVRDEYVRQRRGESTRFDTANQPSSRSPKGGIGERHGDGPSSSSSPSGSEANASAGGAGKPKVTDPDTIIFGYGVPLLTAAGIEEKHARSFLGGLRKHHGDSALIDKLRDCIKVKPLQPLEWLAAALPPEKALDAPKPEAPWFDSVAGVRGKGVELGLGDWSEALWAEGKAPDYLTYRARVFKAAGHSPRAAA